MWHFFCFIRREQHLYASNDYGREKIIMQKINKLLSGTALALAVDWRERPLVSLLTAALLLWGARARCPFGPRLQACCAGLSRISYWVFLIHYPLIMLFGVVVERLWPGQPLPATQPITPAVPSGQLRVAVCGAHLEGQPLNGQLYSKGGQGKRLVCSRRMA